MPLIISSHIMMVMSGHASLMAWATLVTWLRKSCSTVRPGEANQSLDSSPSPSMYTLKDNTKNKWRNGVAGHRNCLEWHQSVPHLLRYAVHLSLDVAPPLASASPSPASPLLFGGDSGCSHTAPSLSGSTWVDASAQTVTEDGHWAVNGKQWCWTPTENVALMANKTSSKPDVRLTSMWPKVCTSGMTSMPLDLANSCIDRTSSRLRTVQAVHRHWTPWT